MSLTEIPFTQYLRPDGRTRPIFVTRAPFVMEQAERLIAAGCHFDVEELTDGTVSMTVERDEDVLAIQLCPNGPRVPPTVDRLMQEACNMLAALRVES